MVRLCIDPGHGGSNTGAQANGLVEKELTLQISKRLESVLYELSDKFQVILTRDDDSTKTFHQRGQVERDFSSTFTLSIHINAATNDMCGVRTFYYPGNRLGEQIARDLMRSFPSPLSSNRMPFSTSEHGWLKRPHHVVSAFRSTCVLLEVGFITSDSDSKFLASETGIAQVVAATAKCLARLI